MHKFDISLVLELQLPAMMRWGIFLYSCCRAKVSSTVRPNTYEMLTSGDVLALTQDHSTHFDPMQCISVLHTPNNTNRYKVLIISPLLPHPGM